MGGGKVAYRKAKKLLDYGALLELVTLKVIDPLNALLQSGQINIDSYNKKYCQNKFIVIAATDDSELNSKIYQDAKENGALVNVVDQIELCDFIIPAVYQDGDLQFAVSTGGKSPALARNLRNNFAEGINKKVKINKDQLNILGSIRDLIKAEVEDESKRKEIFSRLAELVQKGEE